MEISNYDYLKTRVLPFLDSLKVNEYQYRFTVNGDSNIFSSIFALYIFDLFGEVGRFSEDRRLGWINYIQKHQNKYNGCFEPGFEITSRKERNILQLTTFCLSALKILGAKPLHDLPYKSELLEPDFVDKYLLKHKCLVGARGSGNMAMFLGIFITEHYEDTKNELYLKALERWFNLHDNNTNDNGFWGDRLEALYYNGVQNGFHQYVIYYYWDREIKKKSRIEKVIAQLQDAKGHFAPFLGGAACEDYDAIHLLLAMNPVINETPESLKKILKKSYNALLKDLNDDGGFCQTKLSPNKFSLNQIVFVYSNFNSKLFKIKLRKTMGYIFRNRNEIVVNWFDKSRKINESNLWDTWFKVLAIAEIEAFFNVKSKFNFQKAIGLGNYKKLM